MDLTNKLSESRGSIIYLLKEFTILISLLSSSVCNANIYFGLTLEPMLIPGEHLCQNDDKILWALYKANGKEWLIRNFLMEKSRYVKVGFGKENLIILECNLKKGGFDDSVDFLLNIKKGIDFLSHNNDTLYVSGQYLSIDTELFQRDQSYRDTCLSNFFEQSNSEFNSFNSAVRLEFKNEINSQDSIYVCFNPIVRFIRLFNNELEYEYIHMCDSLNLNRVGRHIAEETNADYADYDLYTEYLIKAITQRTKITESIEYAILPISYDASVCSNDFISNDIFFRDSGNKIENTKVEFPYIIILLLILTVLIIIIVYVCKNQIP